MNALIIRIFKYYQKIPFFIIFCCLSLFIFFFFLHPVDGDGDFFHDLNTGRYIMEHKSLPRIDEWTFTAYGKPWVANAWGTGIIYYLLYTSFGPNAISIFISLQAVLLFFLVYLLLRSYKISNNISLLSTLFSFIVISTRWPNRPELTTYPFIISILLINNLRKKYPKIVLILPLLIFIWSILYSGSIFTGLLLLIFLSLLQLYEEKFTIKRSSGIFYVCVIIAILLSFLNGYGSKGVFYILLIPNIAQIQGEWMGIFSVLGLGSPSQLLSLQYEILLFFIFSFMLLILLIFKKNFIGKHPLESLLTCAIISPFFAVRNIPLAVLLSLPLFALILTELHTKLKRIMVILLICFCLFTVSIAWKMNEHGIGQDPVSFPPDIVTFFTRYDLSGNVFTNQQTGSYISYELFPKVLVSSDTRDDLFLSTHILTDLQNTISEQKSIMPLVQTYKANMVLADASDGNSYEPLLYAKTWSLVYVDDKYLLFVNSKIAKEKKLNTYTAIDPFAEDASKKGLEKGAIGEYKNILNQHYSVNSLFHLGNVLLDLNEYNETIEAANRLLVTKDMSSPLFQSNKDYLLGTAYLLSNQCIPAKQFLDDYHNDLSHKFIFNWSEKLPGIDEKEYMIYYLTCAGNPQEAQKHLENYINDPDVSIGEKNNAQNLYKSLISSLHLNMSIPPFSPQENIRLPMDTR